MRVYPGLDVWSDFGGRFPWKSRLIDVDQGVRQAVVDEGPRDAPLTFLLLHGNPTWGYLYREFIRRLSPRYRVIVPDHVGFGRSDKPRDPRWYTLDRHVDNLGRVLRELQPARVVPVITSTVSGTVGLGGSAGVITTGFGAALATTVLAASLGSIGRGWGKPVSPVNRFDTAVPGVVTVLVSKGLRKTSWIRISLLARLRVSACSGVASRLTTGTLTGFPSASFCMSWPAESTSMFCSSVFDTTPMLLEVPGGLPAIGALCVVSNYRFAAMGKCPTR